MSGHPDQNVVPPDQPAVSFEEMSLTGALWIRPSAEPGLVRQLQHELGVGPVLALCLAQRGVQPGDSGEMLLRPSLDGLHDPFLMQGMDAGIDRLKRAVTDQESIRVVTDYDVDGTTSSLILQSTLRLLGSDRLSYHIPHRMDEGYGFSVRAAEAAANDGVSLIVTADIGVKDHQSVTRARELGVDVVILDHHLPPGDDVPGDASVVLCPPQKSCSYPNGALAACGISLKLAQALLREHRKRDAILLSLMKLAALGTVADVVNLFTPENRTIVALGLQELNRGGHKPGLAALLRVADTAPGTIGSRELGFRLGPRINAAGRIDTATSVIELLTAQDHRLARQRAEELDRMNSERRNIQTRMLVQALEEITDPQAAFLLAAQEESPGWHRGVAGIVAARVRDQLHRPAAVVTITPDGATGSIRSIPSVHAVKLLDRASDLLTRYGGHPAAAGFSLPADRVDALRERLVEATLEQLKGQLPVFTRRVDAELQPRELTRSLLRELASLAPHGKGNPEPRLQVSGAQFEGSPRIMKEKHLKAVLLGAEKVEVLWWNEARHHEAFEPGRKVDLLGKLSLNVWRGRETLQFMLDDARPA